MKPSLLLLLLAGCGTDPVNVNGWDMRDFFPFDGERTWEFTSTDETVEQRLIATFDGEGTPNATGTVEYAIRYELVCVIVGDDACTDEWVRTLYWSANQSVGIRIHSVETPDEHIVFDSPVVLATSSMFVGETVQSVEAEGYESTFIGIEPCPVLWTTEWDQCAHLQLTGGSGAGADAIVGDYWAVTNFGVVSIGLAQDDFDWQLSYATFIE